MRRSSLFRHCLLRRSRRLSARYPFCLGSGNGHVLWLCCRPGQREVLSHIDGIGPADMIPTCQQLVIYTKPLSDTVKRISLSYSIGRIASALTLLAIF